MSDAQAQLDWGNTDTGDFFNKALCNQEGPYVTNIAEFAMKPDYKPDPNAEDVMILHARFSIETNKGWLKMTIPMKNALIKLYPGKAPMELINASIMIVAQYKEASGNFSAGYQMVLSNPPATTQPAPTAQEIAF